MNDSATYKDLSCLIIDNSGLSVELAIAMSKSFGKVYYFTEWKQGGFASSNEQQIGTGIDGVVRISSMNEYVRSAVQAKLNNTKQPIDLWIFTWVYDADMQALLRDIGCNVFGAGYGEQIELDRIGLKKLLKAVGLPVIPFKQLEGFDNLITYLQTPGLDTQWVKIPGNYRANSETFKVENYAERKDYIALLKIDFGEAASKIPIICDENMPDMIEWGIDMQICGDKFPSIVSAGIEDKDAGYLNVMKPYKDLPKELTIVTDKLASTFKHFNFNGNFADEIRIGKDKVPYLIDITSRSPFPPSFLQIFAYRNLAKIYNEVANGNPVDPDTKFKYYMEVSIKSEWAKDHWQMVSVAPEFRQYFFFQRLAVVDGNMYIVPHQIKLNDVGSMVVGGNSVEECFKKAAEVEKELKGSDLTISMSCIEYFKKTMDKMSELDLNFFNG